MESETALSGRHRSIVLPVDAADLLAAALGGDTRGIARIITHVENRTTIGRHLFASLYRTSGSAATTGITGAPGAGKSTLVANLIPRLVEESGRIAVVAVDPSSPFTGGAILGDRIRMAEHTADDRVFIRSVANRGALGGISDSTPSIVSALDGLGFGEIVIETVGVGQSEVEIASTADTTVVVVSPGWGDAVQASKAGFLEIADVLVVNKADRPDADQTVHDLSTMLATGPQLAWMPPIVTTIAIDDHGTDDLVEAIRLHRRHLTDSGEQEVRRRRRAAREVAAAIRRQILGDLHTESDSGMLARVFAREVDPWTAADDVLGQP